MAEVFVFVFDVCCHVVMFMVKWSDVWLRKGVVAGLGQVCEAGLDAIPGLQ